MTNEELLQQAKERVAKDNGYNYPDGKNWYRFTFRIPSKRLEEACDEASKRAIQSAREECIEIIEEALACTPQDVDSVLKNGLKKLTAPGR